MLEVPIGVDKLILMVLGKLILVCLWQPLDQLLHFVSDFDVKSVSFTLGVESFHFDSDFTFQLLPLNLIVSKIWLCLPGCRRGNYL